VFAIGLLRRFLYSILDPLAFAPNLFCTHDLSVYGLFQNPGLYTHMIWFKLKPWFEQKPCFCVKTVFYTKRVSKRCFTQKPCYTQTITNTMYYTKTRKNKQKPCSCWGCASGVCGLQDCSFHGSRRNPPKARRALLNDNGLHGLYGLYGPYGPYGPYGFSGPYGPYGPYVYRYRRIERFERTQKFQTRK